METEIEKNTRRLKNTYFFKSLSNELLAELATKVYTINLEKDQVLFRKGDPGDSLYIVLTGWVKIVTQDANGDELVLNHLGPGEAVGDVALIDGEPRSAGVVALVPVRALVLSRDHFLDVMRDQPRVALDVMRGLTAKIRLNTAYIEKAIEWSTRVANGDYSFIEQVSEAHKTIVTMSKQDDERVGEFLSVFYRMVEGVRQREENLQQQVRELSIYVDEARRQQEVDRLTDTDFFQRLKSTTDRMRKRRT
jgi:CRP-like cAMP-binding protein